MMVRFPGVTSSAYISVHGTTLTFCKRVRYIPHTQVAKAYLLFHLTTQILQIMKIASRTKIQQTAGDFDWRSLVTSRREASWTPDGTKLEVTYLIGQMSDRTLEIQHLSHHQLHKSHDRNAP
jgi:hypothetical protein